MPKLELIERGFFRTRPIKLGEIPKGMPASESPPVQVLRVGKFTHPKYGEFVITPLILAEMKDNFDNDVRGVDIAFDYFHESDKEASGWPTQLYLLNEGTELWADVDWTPLAQKKLSERELRYFSPDFAFKWQDPETGAIYNNVLFGGGLTNRPFVKDMAAITAAETKEGNEMTPEEKKQFEAMQAAILKLSEKPPVAAPAAPTAEDHAALKAAHDKLAGENEAMKKKLAEATPAAADPEKDDDSDPAEDSQDPEVLKKQLAQYKEANAKLMAEKKSAEEAKTMAEKNAKFQLMLSEGKACVAQKDAFLKGDMEAFIKLSQPLNMEGRGTSKGANETDGDKDDKVLKLAEEKMKADPKLSKIDAISIANREIK